MVSRRVFELFSDRAIKAVTLSREEAKYAGSKQVTTAYLALGLIIEAAPKNRFYGTGVTVEQARSVVNEIADFQGILLNGKIRSEIHFSAEAIATFEAAERECKRYKNEEVLPEHLLMALISGNTAGGRKVLHRLGINIQELKNGISNRLQTSALSDTDKAQALAAAKNDVTQRLKRKDNKMIVDTLCTDLVAKAKAGHIDPMIGREKELSRVVQILARRTKNNPLLLGEPGVGKTAIIEGLALAIANGQTANGEEIPASLHNKRIMQLDLTQLIAGCKERGELESRTTKLLKELKEDPNLILMIDEIHVLVGAGSARNGQQSGVDIRNILKPPLARGEVRCIGATTTKEHSKYFEKDRALERRFQPVYVDEPTSDQALSILEGLVSKYEMHHQCMYSPEAIQAAVELSTRYISDRKLPDKAIDVLDEAGSRARIFAYDARLRLRMSEEQLKQRVTQLSSLSQVVEAKHLAVSQQCFEEAELLLEREQESKQLLGGSAREGSALPQVDVGDIQSVVAQWSGVPIERMAVDDRRQLASLAEFIGRHVIGQSEAVEAAVKALQRARIGIKDPKRPIASFMFAGPTGVGKTELAKVLSQQVFGTRDALIRLDMGEYMERFSVHKMIGAPPGYIGYGDGGKLTEKMRRNPYCVLLFDEIEKAHADVFNILLQIMEDGRLTDSQGRSVSFKHCLIVLTTNVGQAAIAREGPTRLGFQFFDGATTVEEERYHSLKEHVLEEMKSTFRPEFLNRLDDTIVFRQLERSHIRQIAVNIFSELKERLLNKGFGLHVTPQVMDKVVAEGFDPTMGARPLRRCIMHQVEDPLSDAILGGKLLEGQTALLVLDSEGCVTVDTLESEFEVVESSSESDNDELEIHSLKGSSTTKFLKIAQMESIEA